jgi:amino acid transporter
MAFVIVCASVLLLRIRRPAAERPFRTPWLYVVGPLGIVVNLIMMLFLPLDTWIRLVVWLAVGLTIYFTYGQSRSIIGRRLRGLIPAYSFASPDGVSHNNSIPHSAEAIQPARDHVHDKS